MSLTPSTDLVLEVSRAADPARAAAVMDKLKAMANQSEASPKDFASALETATPAAPFRPTVSGPSATKAQTQLESMLLSQFIGEMLPKDTPSAFGQGYAGEMWRSLLAEKAADQIAASGRLGIASRLFANRPLASHKDLLSPDRASELGQAATTQTSANPLSAPVAAEIERGDVLFAKSGAL